MVQFHISTGHSEKRKLAKRVTGLFCCLLTAWFVAGCGGPVPPLGDSDNKTDDPPPYVDREDPALCGTCHTEHMSHNVSGNWQSICKDCHDTHDSNTANLSLINNQVNGRPVTFTARSGANSFDDGDPSANDGICQVCHTQTKFHTNDGTGTAHNDATNCTMCHIHSIGFMR